MVLYVTHTVLESYLHWNMKKFWVYIGDIVDLSNVNLSMEAMFVALVQGTAGNLHEGPDRHYNLKYHR